MNTQEYHRKRNELYQKMVDVSLIEDTDDNFQMVDTILGELLDVDWDDRGVRMIGIDETHLAAKLAATTSTSKNHIILIKITIIC